MFPISNTFIPVDFFESFGEFDDPQAILITQEGFALIEETQEKLDLRGLPETSLDEVKRWIATAILFTGGSPSEGEASP